MLILLPPSEGKSSPTRGKPFDLTTLSLPALTPARETVLDALTGLSQRPDAAAVLGLGKTQADEVARNAGLRNAPTAAASGIYSGVVYEALDLASLDPSAKRRASSRLAVTSSLFGLVRMNDRIPAYRLSGDVTLPGVGVVSTYWRKHLSPVADDLVGGSLVVDLRSGTYAKFWKPASPRAVSVRVLHEVDGVRKVVSHFNKATKGRLVRSLLADGGAPRTVDGFVDQLRDLGWHVEPGPTSGVLDLVVAQL